MEEQERLLIQAFAIESTAKCPDCGYSEITISETWIRPEFSNATKFWITGDGIKLDHNKSQIPQNDLKKIARYILENRADILAAWFDYFNRL